MRRPSKLAVTGIAFLLLAGGSAVALAQPLGTAPATSTPRGLASLVAHASTTGNVVGIAETSTVPSATDVARLQALGLKVSAMRQLPLAVVTGPLSAMRAAVATGAATDVYPNEQYHYMADSAVRDRASADAMGTAAARAAGYTGKGVTVGVVDSGCDARHPDLAQRVVHNFSVVGPEYLNQPPDPQKYNDSPATVVVDQGRGSNTDVLGGHGTHVAGIIAADGHTSPDHIGVAPDAHLVCYAIGEVLFTTTVVSAYDHMLDQPGMLGIKVINNSWGNNWQQFDPNDPVNVATKAVTDRGAQVVFAAGNAGSGNWEGSLNEFSQAPWLLSVASETVDHHRSDFSSNGLIFDNSLPVALPANGHNTFDGDRVGLYHPDVMAPGEDISSSCNPIGTVTAPCDDMTTGSNATISGTSMATPHVVGALAVLLSANPNLNPIEQRFALQVTAVPDADNLPFWQVGYGRVDLGSAVALALDPTVKSKLLSLQQQRDQQVLAADGMKVRRSDVYSYASPRVAGPGTDTQDLPIEVRSGLSQVRAIFAHSSAYGQLGIDEGSYTLTITDADYQVLATATNGFFSFPIVSVDIAKLTSTPTYGTWHVMISSNRAASDPNTLDSDSILGDQNILAVSQLVAG